MEELDARVDAVLSNTTTAGTKYVYIRSLIRFVQWLHEISTMDRRRELFVPEVLSDSALDGNAAQALLESTPVISPMRLENLTTTDCLRYLTTMVQRGVTGKSTYGNLRSAVVYLFSATNTPLPGNFNIIMKKFFKGLHHTIVAAVQSTNKRLTEGKEPFTLSMYRALSKALLISAKKQDVFGHAFLVICWNLICRAKSTESIRHAHIGWHEDALSVVFAHMKNDQDGNRPRDPRHIYANPVAPEICPILSLGVYFAVLGFSEDGQLFPGGNQYCRFLKVLKEALAVEDIATIVNELGLTPDDFGSHSARKGAATYVSSCSTAGPSAASICLRAGWTLPGVQDKYIRYEAAGDQIVGRYVAGLPFTSAVFATLPPYFVRSDDMNTNKIIADAVNAMFPRAPTCLRAVCRFGLASIVFHEPFLRRELPADHLLFSTALFQDGFSSTLDLLRRQVVCRICCDEDSIAPTGIPPHIGIMLDVNDCKGDIQSIRSGMRSDVEEVIKRHVHGSIMTMEALETAFVVALKRSGIQHGLEFARPKLIEAAEHKQEPSSTAIIVSSPEIFTWNGSLHRVPSGFILPNGTLCSMWQRWCVGRPALRELTKHDMPTRGMKVRLAELRRLMASVEALLPADELGRAYQSVELASSALSTIKNQLPLSRSTLRGRKRRVEQLSWRTLARELKQASNA